MDNYTEVKPDSETSGQSVSPASKQTLKLNNSQRVRHMGSQDRWSVIQMNS
jgi:hypothetical protein